jgi:hypothetical protein
MRLQTILPCEESPSSTAKKTLCSFTNDTFSDFVGKPITLESKPAPREPKSAMCTPTHKKSVSDKAQITAVIKFDATDGQNNYYQKALGKKVTQNLSKYKRTYLNKCTARSNSKKSDTVDDEHFGETQSVTENIRVVSQTYPTSLSLNRC